MRKCKNKISLFLVLCLLVFLYGCGRHEKAAQDAEKKIKIGVCVYNTEFEEMQLFMDYYSDYIALGMPVEFYFSDTPNSGEDERKFIRLAKEEGMDGIISFYGQDIQETLKLCEDEQIYYVLGSGSISDEDFESAKENPYFLGVIGPSAEEEYQAGYGMASNFADQGAKSYLILSGGASKGNFMHSSRVEGILDALSQKESITYGQTTAELAVVSEVTKVETGKEDVNITICPGYMSGSDGSYELQEALRGGNYDAVVSAMSFGQALDGIIDASKDWGHTALLGMVDCFSEGNLKAVQEKDAFGEPKLNYVCGKYASLAGPALAAVYNAATGHPETVRDNGAPFRLNQEFWTADSPEKFKELYNFTQGVYENAYSCDELMQVISVFHANATYQDFAALTEASDIESVEKRILNR